MSNKEQQAYFFDQDSDKHWYMIPVEKRARWNEVNEDDDEDAIIDEFADYMTGGGIDDIEFIPVKLPEGMEE